MSFPLGYSFLNYFVFIDLLEAVVSRVGEYSPNIAAKSADILVLEVQWHSLQFESLKQHDGGLVVGLVAVGADEVVIID